MIEQVFRSARVRHRLQQSLLGPLFNDVTAHLVRRGYALSAVQLYVQSIEHFDRWLRRTRRLATEIDEPVIAQFLDRHLPRCRHVAALIGLREEATALLIAGDMEKLIAALSTEGFSAEYFSDANWTTSAVTTTDADIDLDWGAGAPYPALPADGFSVRWDAHLVAPASGEYTLVADVAGADELVRLYLDDMLILEKTGASATTSLEVVVTLNAATMHRLQLDYADVSGAGSVKLQWKTATTGLEIVPATAAYPGSIVDAFAALATVYHRAGRLITGFKLSETELDHLITFSADFGGIDFKALTAEHWRRVYAYTTLRNAVPQAQAFLTDLFAAANTATPPPTVADLKAIMVRASAWDPTNVDFLVDTHFGLTVGDFKNEIALNRLRTVMDIVSKNGLSAQTIAEWGKAETHFDVLHRTAQLIKNAVKAKYEQEDWLELAGKLSDTLRRHEQEALVAYLLTRPAIQAWGAHDADALFEYFLIDVQMGACMDTSRIVQATASVQMFVNRCLLNLESDASNGIEKGVSATAIDKDRWEWMKAYRPWEANRKVFANPENWLEPDWRKDRSEFFKELEGYLVQNDVTDRTVEQGFRAYLASLNEVANLEICGLARENYDDGKLKYMHVFGRTHNPPYRVYYRRWNEYRRWSAWEKVQVDVRCVEGETPGVHLIPVVWKNRLFLFWPEFSKREVRPGTANKALKDLAENKSSELEPYTYWDIKLAWSEYVDGKWSPKHVTTEFIYQDWWRVFLPSESMLRFATGIDSDDKLTIYFLIEMTSLTGWYQEGAFELTDINSKVVANSFAYGLGYQAWNQANYASNYMSVFTRGKLQLHGDTFLRANTTHNLLLSNSLKNCDPKFDEPFFFADAARSYFVRPVDVPIYQLVANPELLQPFIPDYGYEGRPRFDDRIRDAIERLPKRGPIPGDQATPLMARAPTTPEMKAPATTTSAMTTAMMHPAGETAIAMTSATDDVLSVNYSAGKSAVEKAFGGIWRDSNYEGWKFDIVGWRTGLEFHTFHHPCSTDYVTNLNRAGLPSLMESDTNVPSDEGALFESVYDPDLSYGKVLKPGDFADHTYYKQNVCFDVYGANSLYNWELFFHAPLYIATRLSKNGKYEEAMKWFHYIFDPTTDDLPAAGESAVSRYWKVLPFKTTPAKSLEDLFRSLSPSSDTENAIVREWRDNPFDPHLVASNRPLAYMKHVVLKYVENLVDWGDSLFRKDTRESISEALQLYTIANHILGARPQFVPRRGTVKSESYKSLESKWDDFSNALVALENVFPYSSEASVSGSSIGTSLLGMGATLDGCIPPNEKLMEYWDTVADRLFKIRHCQNLDGVERKLAVFAPPIEPAALIQAASQGLSLGSILADLSSPPPIYRFTFLIAKANEFCADVKSLGAALLAALEKEEAEDLARLRASHETQMLELITTVRERQLLAAKATKENLEKSRETAEFRLQHFVDLLGNDAVTIPSAPTLPVTLSADSQLPADTIITKVETDIDQALAETDEAGVKIITKEKLELDKLDTARDWQTQAKAMEGLAAIAHVIPTVSAKGMPLGVGTAARWGGTQLGNAFTAAGRVLDFIGSYAVHDATIAAKMAAFIRREQDWTLQANLAAREIVQIDKQITSADIQIQIAEAELTNHKQSIENARAVEQFLKDKFTGQELYVWMKERLFDVYKQAYNLAYDMAKKAEKAYKQELGIETAGFVQYGYWDNTNQGLVAAERLQLALRQLEKSYIEENRRELELNKNASLARLDPRALIELRETGRCWVSLPEELFDLDFRGHYFRRIRAVRLSIPCVAGPLTTIGCSLRLLGNWVRIDTSMNSDGNYERENDGGVPIDDARFRTMRPPTTAIATSQGQNDAGLFELNFRDERYLPFEGAGAISDWQIELSTDDQLRPFDYSTISDVILHVSYTAREDGGLFKEKATTYINDFLINAAELSEEPLLQMFSMKHEFPTECYRFLHPATAGAEQILSFTLSKDRFPFFVHDRELVVSKIELFARCTGETSYHAVLSYTDINDEPALFTLR